MKNILRQVFIFALIFALAIPVNAADTVQATTLRLEQTEGTVDLANKLGKAVSIINGMKLFNGYQLRTDLASYAHMSLDSTSIVKMDASSHTEVAQRGNKFEVLVHSGNILINVSEPLNDGNLDIRTSSMVTSIRGTAVHVRVIDEFRTEVLFLDGHGTITVLDPLSGELKTMELYAGQKALLCAASDRDGLTYLADIQIGTITEQDIAGFVSVELAENPELAARVQSQTALDVNALIAGAYTQLASEEKKAEQNHAEILAKMAEEINVKSVDPLFEKQEDAPPTSQGQSGSGNTGGASESSTGANSEKPAAESVPPAVETPITAEPVRSSDRTSGGGSSSSSGGSSTPSNPSTPLSRNLIIENDFTFIERRYDNGLNRYFDVYEDNGETAAALAAFNDVTISGKDPLVDLDFNSPLIIPVSKSLTVQSGTIWFDDLTVNGVLANNSYETIPNGSGQGGDVFGIDGYAIAVNGEFTNNGAAWFNSLTNNSSNSVYNNGEMVVHTLNNTGNGKFVNAGELQIGNSSYSDGSFINAGRLINTGEIYLDTDSTFINAHDGHFTMSNGSFWAENSAIINNSGTVEITGGGISSNGYCIVSSGGNTIISGGMFHSYGDYTFSYGVGTLPIRISNQPVITSDGPGIIDDISKLIHTDSNVTLSQVRESGIWKLTYSGATQNSAVMVIEEDFTPDGNGNYIDNGEITAMFTSTDNIILTSNNGSTLILSSILDIENSKTLTFSNGKITDNRIVPDYSAMIRIRGGTFVMQSGSLDSIAKCVDNFGGTMVMEGGLIKSVPYNSTVHSDGVFTMLDGTIKGQMSVGGEMYMYGGTIISDNETAVWIFNGTFTMNGAQISSNMDGIEIGGTTGGSANISNGSITGGEYGIDNYDAQLVISDSTVTGGEYGVYNAMGGTAEISNCTIIGGENGIYNWVGEVTVTDSNITGNNNYCAVYTDGNSFIMQGGTLTGGVLLKDTDTRISGVTITNNNCGVYIISGNTVLSDCDIISSANWGISNSQGILEIINCTIASNNPCVDIYNGGSAYISGGSMESSNDYALECDTSLPIYISYTPTIRGNLGVVSDFTNLIHTDPNITLSQVQNGGTWELVYTSTFVAPLAVPFATPGTTAPASGIIIEDREKPKSDNEDEESGDDSDDTGVAPVATSGTTASGEG